MVGSMAAWRSFVKRLVKLGCTISAGAGVILPSVHTVRRALCRVRGAYSCEPNACATACTRAA